MSDTATQKTPNINRGEKGQPQSTKSEQPTQPWGVEKSSQE